MEGRSVARRNHILALTVIVNHGRSHSLSTEELLSSEDEGLINIEGRILVEFINTNSVAITTTVPLNLELNLLL